MSNEEVFQTMRDLVAEQFAQEPDEVTMKANIPSRIAFAVASSLESRIILDTQGAEKLVGRGDMLYFPLGSGKPTRVQGCFISPEEIERVVEFAKQTGEAHYSDEVMQKIEENVQQKEKSSGGKGGAVPEPVEDEGDELLPAAVDVVLETGQASVSMDRVLLCEALNH